MKITTRCARRHIQWIVSTLLWHPVASQPGRDLEVPNRDPAARQLEKHHVRGYL